MKQRVDHLLRLPRQVKSAVALTLDTAVCLLSVAVAYYLRLGEWNVFFGNQWLSVAVSLLALPIFWTFGLYRAIFRYLGYDAMVGLARACLLYGLVYAAVFTFLGVADVPRTVGLIQPVILFIGIGASRALVRSILGSLKVGDGVTTVLIYGAGSSGRQLLAALIGTNEMRVVGFVDDDPTLHGSVLNGRKIFAPDDLPDVVDRFGVTDILLAMPSASRKRRGEIVERLRPLSLKVRTIPGLVDLAEGRIQVTALRPLEIEDLLGRDPAAPNEVLFARNILEKTVLVTGAGGSIGSELCRQIIRAHPKVLLLVDNSEYALYAIDAELRNMVGQTSPRIVPLLASVRDCGRMEKIMSAWHPDTVYHAAAYKHVPLVEHNPIEGVLNNVFGTITTARVAMSCGVSDFVLISTDKAVRPTNVMGTTKRLAELYLQGLASSKTDTRFSMVRFGNVLGSSGSVVPLFRSQIACGGPITITHEQVTRYFMTIPEAAQLVIQAGAMAVGGEVFILDMGQPVKIVDLAHKMIQLSGLSLRNADDPDGDIEVVVTGLRPGEKLYEELLIGEHSSPTGHPLIFKALEASLPLADLEAQLTALRSALDAHDVGAVHAFLRRAVPEFAPEGGTADWLEVEHERRSRSVAA